MPTWPKQDRMNSFYGNPDKDRNGQPDPSWTRENLVKLIPPYQLYYPKEILRNGKKVMVPRATKWQALTVHKKCAESLNICLTGIKEAFTQDEIQKYDLDICGGTWVFRLMRSGRSLSIHSWGAAIDLSHLINYYGRPYSEGKGMMPQKAVGIFRAQGWVWGGRWKTGDAMHFQASTL